MPKGDRKFLSYLVAPGVTLESLAAAWRGFSYESGRWKCVLSGPWGVIQVWASSEAEGRRVAEKALSAGGWNDRASEGLWSSREVSGTRWAAPRTWTTAEGNGLIGVSMRDGPNGSPNYADG